MCVVVKSRSKRQLGIYLRSLYRKYCNSFDIIEVYEEIHFGCLALLRNEMDFFSRNVVRMQM
jgi:hypothetical protein